MLNHLEKGLLININTWRESNIKFFIIVILIKKTKSLTIIKIELLMSI